MNKKRALIWVGVAVSVFALWWTFRDADWKAIRFALSRVDWLLLITAIPTIFSSLLLRAYRWSYFIRDDQSSLRLRYDAVNIGFMVTSLLPLRLGELARVLVFAQKAARSRLEIFATIAAERLFDVLALLIVFIAVLPFLPFQAIETSSAGIMGFFGMTGGLSRNGLMIFSGGIVALSLLGFILLCSHGRAISHAIMVKFGVTHPRLIQWLGSLFDGLEALWHGRRVFPALGLSVVLWFNVAVTFWITLLAFPSGSTTLGAILGLDGAIFLDTVLCVGVALPSAPGFFGVWHAATKVAFIPYPSADQGSILAFALLIHLLSFGMSILFGIESLRHQGIKWSEVKHVDSPAEG